MRAHVFVIKCEEMTNETMGGPRRSGISKRSYYIEFSHNKDFYSTREWYCKGPSSLEHDLFKNLKNTEKDGMN